MLKRPAKLILSGLIIIAVLAAVPFAFRATVNKLGENSLLQLARDGGFCQTESCEEGVNYTIGFLETNYSLAPDDVKWCMGVDVIAHKQLFFGNGLKKKATDMMYDRCGNPAEDEPQDDIPAE